jgi:hypothetical protein
MCILSAEFIERKRREEDHILGTHQKGRQEKTGHALKDSVYCHDLHNGDTPN